jgi:hypothetical protein
MIKEYIGCQLAASGLALLDKSIAFSSGLWHSQTNCHMQFRDMEVLIKQFGRGCEKTVVPTFAKEFDARYTKEMAAKAREEQQAWLAERRRA